MGTNLSTVLVHKNYIEERKILVVGSQEIRRRAEKIRTTEKIRLKKLG